jgi:hypothetical protein
MVESAPCPYIPCKGRERKVAQALHSQSTLLECVVYRKGRETGQLGGDVCVDHLHVTDAHGNRMGPGSTIGTEFVFEGFHQILNRWRVARVAGCSLSCFVPRPRPPIAPIFITIKKSRLGQHLSEE